VLTAITGGAAATVGFTVALDVGADAGADAETDDEVCNDDVDVADTAGLDAEPPPPHHHRRHSVRRHYPTPIMPWCFVLTSLRFF